MRLHLHHLILILVLQGVSGSASAELGIAGGLSALSGCVQSCSEENELKPSENECLRFCRCVLTVESTKWAEELGDSQIKARARSCRANVWPHYFVAPENEGGGKLVLICTPKVTDRYGNFPPEEEIALNDGSVTQHWKEVDQALNALKKDKESALFVEAAKAQSLVAIVINTRKETQKVRQISSDKPCPPRHIGEQFLLDRWLLIDGRTGRTKH